MSDSIVHLLAQLGTWIVIALFWVATISLMLYGLHLYVLVYLLNRRSARHRRGQREVIGRYRQSTSSEDWPIVTSQLPIYNEADVAERVLEAVAGMDYPPGRHEVQVLDDSSDQTRELIDRVAERLRGRGVDVQVIRRGDRSGYKAGALAYGLAKARGKYVAVFDADFVPPREFLREAIPLLEDAPDLACIQGRWSHLNKGESWLTEAQALGIDGHFAIEQGARAWNGLMMNFNGTAGVWRADAINDPKVGGWSGDTLTEDLDLSYRAQLGGWRLDYCLDLPCPAELPSTVRALKSQQRRWATGSIQVARKLLPRIWRAPLGLGEKIEATIHLTHYAVTLWMLVMAVLAYPMMLLFARHKLVGSWFWLGWLVVLVASVAPSATYTYARYTLGGGWSGLLRVPSLIALGCGLCLNNGLAVLRGLYLEGGEFVRTPKSGSMSAQRRRSTYKVGQDALWIVEILMGVYAAWCFLIHFILYRQGIHVFLLFYAVGFCIVGWLSRPEPPPHGRATPAVA